MSSRFFNFVDFGRKIIGAARTYREHALELNNPVPSEPLVFLKPTSSYVVEGQSIKIPKGATELHHEVELGVVISKAGKHIPPEQVIDHVAGYVLALDMTDRAEQARAKKAGTSWCLAKGFDTACPVSAFIPKEELADCQNVGLRLAVNRVVKQDGNTRDMMITIPDLVSWISDRMLLEPGDLILTGTPPGVGPVGPGDTIECFLNDGQMKMTFKVTTE